MTDTLLTIFSGIAIVVGIAGCILPALPGPPICYAGLVLLQFTSSHPFTTKFLLVFAGLTILVTLLDYVMPVYGTKKLQGSKYGVWGSAIGLVIGVISFLFVGIIIGPLLGAFFGELIAGKHVDRAIKSAMGSLLGFLTGAAAKLTLSLVMAYYFLVSLF